jgi:hypothetical protein
MGFARSGQGSDLMALLGDRVSRLNTERTFFSGLLRSVDDWPMAKILNQISGGKLKSVSVGVI